MPPKIPRVLPVSGMLLKRSFSSYVSGGDACAAKIKLRAGDAKSLSAALSHGEKRPVASTSSPRASGGSRPYTFFTRQGARPTSATSSVL